MQVFKVISIVASGLMVGNELAVGVFVHPTLRRLHDDTHAESARALALLYGRVMPLWYAAVLLLSVILSISLYQVNSSGFHLALASSGLWLTSIIFTLLGPVRINNRVAQWDLNHLPLAWKSDRRRWDMLHAIRVAILLAAFISQVIACL